MITVILVVVGGGGGSGGGGTTGGVVLSSLARWPKGTTPHLFRGFEVGDSNFR